MTIQEKLSALRREMEREGVDVYYIPTADFHETEYVGEYFKTRKYMTGFTGSAGVAVITMKDAGLWTDGRYYIQAERELEGTGIDLYRSGMWNVVKSDAFMAVRVPAGGVIGMDGRVVNARLGKRLQSLIEKKKATIRADLDLVDRLWPDRPAMSAEPLEDFPVQYAGLDRKNKIEEIREIMQREKCDVHILSTLDNIAWLLNVRGGDITHFPVPLGFVILTQTDLRYFVQTKAVPEDLRQQLEADGITLCPYEDIYREVEKLPENACVMVDLSKINWRLMTSIPKNCEIIDCINPEVRLQAKKNSTELGNIRKAHVKDGIACTKFMYWLKKNIGKIPMTERSAQDYLENCRREQEGFLDLSFDTISAYGPNAAMMHYSVSDEHNAVLEPRGFLLVDSGGHYREGSTDITRTYALGPVTEKEKKFYTAVLQGHMRLANARFLYGCKGMNLDILARGPIWDLEADYRCGTGHGVGYRLNIHEAPNGFRWRVVEERNDSCVLEPGMVTTDEPGYYEEGAFGIRIENELVCRDAVTNEYGQFLQFETITYAPIDLEPVDLTQLSKQEIGWINAYHAMVREVLEPYLEGEELAFLREVTKAV